MPILMLKLLETNAQADGNGNQRIAGLADSNPVLFSSELTTALPSMFCFGC